MILSEVHAVMRLPTQSVVAGGPAADNVHHSFRPPGLTSLRSLSRGAQIAAANAGDHPLILRFLTQTSQLSLEEDFQNRLDEPTYSPSDRLLVWRNGEMAGHVQVCRRVGWFGNQRIPLATFVDFATLPEYQRTDYASALLETAESTAKREGAVLGLVRTTRRAWYAERGWSSISGQGYTRANTQNILAYFDSQRGHRRRRKKPTTEVRSWRHYQLDAIRNIYQANAPHMWGPIQRSEAWWQWLVGRKAHDQILLAAERADARNSDQNGARKADGIDSGSLETSGQDALGYAVVRNSCLVEMFTMPGRDSVRSLLLARACRDAIDRGHHSISLHTPASDPLHEVMVTAGGSWIPNDADRDGCWMFRLLSPEKWVDKLYPVLHGRARAAGLARPLHLTLPSPVGNYRLTLTRRSARLEKCNRNGVHSADLRREVQDVLTSNSSHEESPPGSFESLTHLFPLELFWQSPFEWLRL